MLITKQVTWSICIPNEEEPPLLSGVFFCLGTFGTRSIWVAKKIVIPLSPYHESSLLRVIGASLFLPILKTQMNTTYQQNSFGYIQCLAYHYPLDLSWNNISIQLIYFCLELLLVLHTTSTSQFVQDRYEFLPINCSIWWKM